MAVLTRAREQQAEEAEDYHQPEEKEVSRRQRSNYQRSGINAKRAILGTQKQETEEEPTRKVKYQKSNFKSPQDFYAGPQQPGRVTGGPRRFEDRESDTVGYMLSDKFLESTDGCEKKNKNLGGRDHVDNKCFPTQPEARPPSGVKMIKEPEGMDAPWFESNNPKPPRENDVAPPSGVKFYPQSHPPATATTFVYGPQHAYRQPAHGNRKNESHDVTNLGRYSAKQLNESEGPQGHYGPVKWRAPEMDYPVRRPAIRPVTGKCTECHDVLGTQRFGRATEAPRSGVAHVDPPVKDHKNLLATVEQPKQQPRPVKQDRIFRYYDPTRDDPARFTDDRKTTGKGHPGGKTANHESRSHFVPHGGKGRGMYARNGRASNQPLA